MFHSYKQARIVIAFVHIVHIVYCLFLFISASLLVCCIFLYVCIFSFSSFDYYFGE